MTVWQPTSYRPEIWISPARSPVLIKHIAGAMPPTRNVARVGFQALKESSNGESRIHQFWMINLALGTLVESIMKQFFTMGPWLALACPWHSFSSGISKKDAVSFLSQVRSSAEYPRILWRGRSLAQNHSVKIF